MKRLFSFLLSILICINLTACGGIFVAESTEQESVITEFAALNDIEEGRPNIYLIVKVVSSSYWQSIAKAVKSAAITEGCNVFWAGTDNDSDWKGQKVLIEEAIEKGADAIILAPNDSVKLVKSIKEAKKQDIPVVLVDTIVNTDKFDACFMTENILAGKSAAEEMVNQLKEKGHTEDEEVYIGIMPGNSSSQTVNERLAGFYQYWVENAPKKWKICDDILEWDNDASTGAKKVEIFLENNKDIVGLFATNNGPTQAIAKAVSNKERKDIVLVGFDFSDEIKSLIIDSDYTASSVVQRQFDMGYKAVVTAKDMLAGNTPSQKYYDTGIVVINNSNYQNEDIQQMLSYY
ncbi:ribose transport system substrate-binding protein [Pseudobutyrivibrio sp. YE44]|uniref:ABC transporter substrate-binding protein n=1 Tax=Pseudobutyrivibrio sp. YE44 TaxID=1520802 RepID=UPI0008862AFB|nr:ABC transporter substrate-binding protein [Pseudobutyrivibrio sp. YE44]SDB04320.1 ribose transport system substrate-binding protein [Pseudobutyrivibrio sp. YE44]